MNSWIVLLLVTAKVLAVHAACNNLGNGGSDTKSQTPIGSMKNPGGSCADILRRRSDSSLPNGVYWIKFGTGKKFGSKQFPVFCDMESGGWTMVFKTVAGYPKTRIRSWWTNPLTSTESSIAALNTKAVFKGIYKNRIVSVTNWPKFKPQEVRMVLYSHSVVQLVLRFDAKASTYLNWFSASRLLESPWYDITTEKHNYFTISGPCWSAQCRDFHINNAYGGCPGDVGWLSLGGATCPWEKRFPGNSFIFSKKGTKVNYNHYNGVGSAEVFAVYVR